VASGRSPGARAIVACFPGELVIYLPPKRLRAEAIAALGFAAVWLGFVAFWTTFVAILYAKDQEGDSIGLHMLLFSTPFWLVGLGILACTTWTLWGAHALHCHREELVLTRRWRRWQWAWWADLPSVREARVYRSLVQTNGKHALGAEVVHDRGSFVLPAETWAEARWLVYEMNDFLKVVREPAA
jgi:hypothetical protein